MTNSEARKRQEEAKQSIVAQIMNSEGETLSLNMSAGAALMTVGDLMSAALQLLAQAIRHLSTDDNEQGETA
jgi:hypothetical protein